MCRRHTTLPPILQGLDSVAAMFDHKHFPSKIYVISCIILCARCAFQNGTLRNLKDNVYDGLGQG